MQRTPFKGEEGIGKPPGLPKMPIKALSKTEGDATCDGSALADGCTQCDFTNAAEKEPQTVELESQRGPDSCNTLTHSTVEPNDPVHTGAHDSAQADIANEEPLPSDILTEKKPSFRCYTFFDLGFFSIKLIPKGYSTRDCSTQRETPGILPFGERQSSPVVVLKSEMPSAEATSDSHGDETLDD